MKPILILLTLLFMLGNPSPTSSQIVICQSSFEPPDFQIGALRNQNGWYPSSATSNDNYVRVVSGNASVGQQCVAIDTSRLSTTATFAFTSPTFLYTVTPDAPLLEWTADIRYAPGVLEPTRMQFTFESTTQSVYLGVVLFPAGYVYFQTPSDYVAPPSGAFSLTEYTRLRLLLNYANQRARLQIGNLDLQLTMTSPFGTILRRGFFLFGTAAANSPAPHDDIWYIDNIRFVALSSATVSGNVFLEGSVNPAQSVDFTFVPAVGSAFTRTVTLSSTGAYNLTGIPFGNYTVSIKGGKWLKRNITVDTRWGNIANANAFLLAGDANDDNAVDITDLLALIAHYNQTAPSADYLDAADFNGDGINDITDLLLLIGNYNKLGD